MKKRRKPKIVRTADYNCAYLSKMAVLIIFPVFFLTVINLTMLSIERQKLLMIMLYINLPCTFTLLTWTMHNSSI